eukprot:Opistho-1_new@82253
MVKSAAAPKSKPKTAPANGTTKPKKKDARAKKLTKSKAEALLARVNGQLDDVRTSMLPPPPTQPLLADRPRSETRVTLEDVAAAEAAAAARLDDALRSMQAL